MYLLENNILILQTQINRSLYYLNPERGTVHWAIFKKDRTTVKQYPSLLALPPSPTTSNSIHRNNPLIPQTQKFINRTLYNLNPDSRAPFSFFNYIVNTIVKGYILSIPQAVKTRYPAEYTEPRSRKYCNTHRNISMITAMALTVNVEPASLRSLSRFHSFVWLKQHLPPLLERIRTTPVLASCIVHKRELLCIL